MRETIYKLADSEYNQIICTTHSPYMIDLGKKPNQILNLLSVSNQIIDGQEEEKTICNPFNISKAYRDLLDDEKSYIKMLLKIDDYVAKVFFVKNVVIIEGDTEEVVIRETIELLDEDTKIKIFQNWQIVKVRGKATIISLVKFLKSMGINPKVIHDKDIGTAGAEVFNQPIANAVGDSTKVFALQNCLEDVLGYSAPDREKPYKAYKYIKDNWSERTKVSSEWMSIFESVFEIN